MNLYIYTWTLQQVYLVTPGDKSGAQVHHQTGPVFKQPRSSGGPRNPIESDVRNAPTQANTVNMPDPSDRPEE